LRAAVVFFAMIGNPFVNVEIVWVQSLRVCAWGSIDEMRKVYRRVENGSTK
jgi:hypothetical protein